MPRRPSRRRSSARAAPPKRRWDAWSPGCCGSRTRPNPRTPRTAWPWRSRTSSGRDRAGLGPARREAGRSRDDRDPRRGGLRDRRPVGGDGATARGRRGGERAVKERNIALLASVSGIGKRTAERLALELADKLGEFDELAEAGAGPTGRGGARGAAEAALHALERLGYATAEADGALRQALAADGGGDTETLVRRALQLLTHG